MIKNVIIINDFNYSQGGASKVAIDTANLLSDFGINCVFFSPSFGGLFIKELNSKVKLVTLYQKDFLTMKFKLNGMMKGIWNRSVYISLKKLLKEYDCKDTIIHIHGWTKSCSSSVFKACKNYKCFLTLHDYFSLCPNGALFNYRNCNVCKLKPMSFKCFFSNCDSRSYLFKLYRYIRQLSYKKNIKLKKINLIFISEFEKKIFSNYIDLYKCKCFTLYNPISLDLNRINVNENVEKKYDFVYIGRNSKEKGSDLYYKLVRSMPDKKFLFVGQSEELIENLNVTGWVPESEVVKYLMLSKCYVFPSMWPETFGLNVLNALRLHIPCVVSNNTSAEDFVSNGKNGYIFEQGNFESLYNACENIEKITYEFDEHKFDYLECLLKIYNM